MKRIDVNDWKEFTIKDIFKTETKGKSVQVPTGGQIATKLLSEGGTPRITVSGVNNGIVGCYSDIDNKNYRIYKNFISVSFLGTVFYQSGRASLDMKVHCLKPLDIELTNNTGTFLVTVIRVAIRRFVYQDQLSSTVLPNITLTLPATASGDPDWEYMELYMSKVLSESETRLELLESVTRGQEDNR